MLLPNCQGRSKGSYGAAARIEVWRGEQIWSSLPPRKRGLIRVQNSSWGGGAILDNEGGIFCLNFVKPPPGPPSKHIVKGAPIWTPARTTKTPCYGPANCQLWKKKYLEITFFRRDSQLWSNVWSWWPEELAIHLLLRTPESTSPL